MNKQERSHLLVHMLAEILMDVNNHSNSVTVNQSLVRPRRKEKEIGSRKGDLQKSTLRARLTSGTRLVFRIL